MRFLPFALPPAALHERLSRLRWDFRKWDTHVRGKETLAHGALVLTRSEHAELARASEALFAACDEAARAWVDDEAATRELGVPPDARRLVGAWGPRVTRIDWFLTTEGWRASECNDDVPGGYNDALGLVALFADAVEKGIEVPGDLPEALLRLIAPEGTRRVGFVYATAYAEDLQVVRLLADLCELRGLETTLASPAHLAHEDGRTTLAGEPVDVVYRFFPTEWFPQLPNLDDWARAVAAGLRVVNPFSGAWTQSKASFALLSRSRDLGHVPRTRRLTRANAAEAVASRESLVLKPCFGRMGEGIVLGASVTQHDWRDAIEGALRREQGFVVQERFRPLPLETTPGQSVVPCVGAYVVDGRFAGYYSRFSRKDAVRFDASNVLTMVEAV